MIWVEGAREGQENDDREGQRGTTSLTAPARARYGQSVPSVPQPGLLSTLLSGCLVQAQAQAQTQTQAQRVKSLRLGVDERRGSEDSVRQTWAPPGALEPWRID